MIDWNDCINRFTVSKIKCNLTFYFSTFFLRSQGYILLWMQWSLDSWLSYWRSFTPYVNVRAQTLVIIEFGILMTVYLHLICRCILHLVVARSRVWWGVEGTWNFYGRKSERLLWKFGPLDHRKISDYLPVMLATFFIKLKISKGFYACCLKKFLQSWKHFFLTFT